jgi:pilus assembly protein CpaB
MLGMIAALLLAAVGTFTIVAYVHGANKRALDGQQVIDVLVVQKTIPAGTPADALGKSVALESVVKKVEAEGAVTNIKDLKGRVASATLVPGEQLVQARFTNASAFRASGAGVSVPAGLLESTIALDPERALGGLVTPGAHVAVTASFGAKDNSPAATHIILHQVLVTNVQLTQASDSKALSSASTTSASGSGPKDGNAPAGRLFVTLALDAASSERVIFAAEQGTLWLSSEPTGAPTAGTKIVTRGDVLQ